MIIKSEIEKALYTLNRKLEGKSSGRWFYTEDGVKRQTHNKQGKKSFQRFTKRLWKNLSDKEIEQLLVILNYEEKREKDAREKYTVRTSYIPKKLLIEFHEQLVAEIPTQETVDYNYSRLRNHFLGFFDQHDPNPIIWHRDYVPKWTAYLEENFRYTTIKGIVGVSNRFMKFLHRKLPDTYPLIQFEPITKSKARRLQVTNPKKERKFIKDKDAKKLINTLSPDLAAFVEICLAYGLRRGECMYLAENSSQIKKGYLHITKQLKRFDKNKKRYDGPVKDLDVRKVPHWYMTPNRCFLLISKLKLMSPAECTRKIGDESEKLLGVRYTPHDFRHTFITNAVNTYDMNDVRLAVGHEDLTTLSLYLKDGRDQDDEEFKPN